MNESENKVFTILIPCFNEEENIESILEAITSLKLNYRIQVVFVDDGSTDSSWDKIQENLNKHESLMITAIRLTRNFGKESAIEAGMKYYKGEFIITMDCDLQHPVSLIPELIGAWEKNKEIHIVNAIKKSRQAESLIKRKMVNWYYKIFNVFTGMSLANHSDYKLIDKRVVNQYLQLNEVNKFYRGLTKWLGFASMDVEFIPEKREKGAESWSYGNLFSYAKKSILSFSYIPLKAITWVGFVSFVFSFILTIDTLLKKINGESAEGFPTVILLILGIGSLILFCLGIIGEYLSEIFKEIKKRPAYIIMDEKSGEKDK